MEEKEIEITASLEDYLKTIYFLNGKNKNVRITDIAAELKISKPSVNRAINTLKSYGLVEHEYYGALMLTEEGVKLAENVAIEHMTLKRFLVEVLHVDEATADKEACLMEHCLSMDTTERVMEYMGRKQGNFCQEEN